MLQLVFFAGVTGRHVQLGTEDSLPIYRYCLARVDRFSRWPEAVQKLPMHLSIGCISRFGVSIEEDGSTLFKESTREYSKLAGCFYTPRCSREANLVAAFERWIFSNHRTKRQTFVVRVSGRGTRVDGQWNICTRCIRNETQNRSTP